MEHLVTRSIFYLIMIFVLVGFFQVLGLTLVTEPLNRLLTEVFRFVPQLLAAGILLLIAWILATGLKLVVVRLLGVANLDEKIGNQAGRSVTLTKTLGDTVYWVVFLLFLPAILNAHHRPFSSGNGPWRASSNGPWRLAKPDGGGRRQRQTV